MKERSKQKNKAENSTLSEEKRIQETMIINRKSKLVNLKVYHMPLQKKKKKKYLDLNGRCTRFLC